MNRRMFVPTLTLAGGVVLLAACGSGAGASRYGQATPVAQAATAAAAPVAVQTTTATAVAAQAATPAVNAAERVTGSVQAIDGSKVTLKEGVSFTLTPQTTVTSRLPSAASMLQKGQVVAITAKRQPDNTLLASIVTVFAMPPSGFSLGQRPMDAGNLMTNATIETVDASGFSVSFPGGDAKVAVAPDAQVNVLTVGTPADITVGATISALVRDGAAQTVSVQ